MASQGGVYFTRETNRGTVAEVAPERVAVGAVLSVTDDESFPRTRSARVTGLGRTFRRRVYVIDEDASFEGVRAAGWEEIQYAYLSFDLAASPVPARKATPAAPKPDPLAVAAELAAAEIKAGKAFYGERWVPAYEQGIVERLARTYAVPADQIAAAVAR